MSHAKTNRLPAAPGTQSVSAHRVRTGVTLIETIAALVILAVAIPPLLVGLSDHTKRRHDMIQISVARRLAAERIEEVIADRHADGRGWEWLSPDNYPDEAAVDGFTPYRRHVRFTDLGPDLQPGGTGVRLIEVTVEWTRLSGTTQNLSLRTLVAEFTP